MWIDHFDLLVRSLLQRTDQPAVLILSHFSPQTHAAHGYNDPSHMHNLVAQFYDVPLLSTKSAVFPDFISNPTFAKSTYWVDPMLSNPTGHELLSDVLVSYFQEMTCKGWDTALGRGFDIPIFSSTSGPNAGSGLFGGVGGRKGGVDGPGAPGKVQAVDNSGSPLRIPLLRVNDRSPLSAHFREPRPFCVSANDLINPLPPSLFYGSGWQAHHPGSGGSDEAGATGYYWYSTLPTSKLRVPIKLAAGDVGIYYMMEPRGDFRDGGPGVLCWVDDNVAGAVEISGVGDVGGPVPKYVRIWGLEPETDDWV